MNNDELLWDIYETLDKANIGYDKITMSYDGHLCTGSGLGSSFSSEDYCLYLRPHSVSIMTNAELLDHISIHSIFRTPHPCRVPSDKELKEFGIMPDKNFPAESIKCCINCQDYNKNTNCQHCYKPKTDPNYPNLGREQCLLQVPCGLHVICVGRNTLRRHDNKILRRLSLKGEPFSSRFYICAAERWLPPSFIKALKTMADKNQPVLNPGKLGNRSILKRQQRCRKYLIKTLNRL